MQLDKELYMKFPVVLRDKLINGEIKLPDTVLFEYEKILTYRAVERKKDDIREITLDDFKSYFELNKKPKTPRGVNADIAKDPHYYGVSSFLKKEIVEQLMKFPNPNKKMAEGYVYKEGGPQDTKDQHVCWWLYENADVSGFKLKEN
jgi:hypothetical protein